jgi:hypothetical protein
MEPNRAHLFLEARKLIPEKDKEHDHLYSKVFGILEKRDP